MDAAYALMVRTYAGIPGKNLIEAVELANESFGISPPGEVKAAETAARNSAAVAELNSQMAGMQRRR